MLFKTVAVAALIPSTIAQSLTLSGTNTASEAVSGGDYVTGTYRSYTSTISLSQTSQSYTYISGVSTTGSTTSVRNETITTNGTVLTTASPTQTYLTGNPQNTSTHATSSTSSSARPTNTQPCNGYPEFCQRSYSNITHIAAHNSPFNIKGNIASNQAYDVTTQLNDGVRMLQFQVHKPNASSPLMLCHTSCDLLNAGTLVDYLTSVNEWLDNNPYDVITILMGNYDVLKPSEFEDPVYSSGIIKYVYTPPTVPMGLGDWPTMAEMILTQNRVVMMLDYEADQSAIPWLLDEFANMWETPFSPTDPAFPCTVDRPPDQDRNTSANRMYMINHNLNVDIQIAGLSLLIPAFTLLNQTNGIEGYGSAGGAVLNCSSDWNRPPNFILVDYYNIGSFNGSVFQVAADANGVSYNRDTCCGNGQRVSAAPRGRSIDLTLMSAVAGILAFWML